MIKTSRAITIGVITVLTIQASARANPALALPAARPCGAGGVVVGMMLTPNDPLAAIVGADSVRITLNEREKPPAKFGDGTGGL